MEGINKLAYFAVLLLWKVFPCAYTEETYANETALRTLLESGYSTAVRPRTPTTINIFFALRVLDSLDITSQTMTTMGLMGMFWTDPRLTWNATDYSNISQLDVNWAWRPEYAVTNAADAIALYGTSNDDVRFRMYSDGTVRWVQTMLQRTVCDVNIKQFPFDTQTCSIEIVYWGMNGVDVDANITRHVATTNYIQNAEWVYNGGSLSTFPIAVCCPAQTLTMVKIELQFTRLRPFYVINFIVPALLLALCMLLAFLLPTECGERLGYSLTILLSYTVLLTIVADMMPTTSKQTPHIALFLLILLVLCSIAVVNVVIAVKIFYFETTPPSWLQKLTLKLQPVIFLQCRKTPKKVEPAESDELGEPIKKPIPAFSGQDGDDDDKTLHGKITWADISILQDRMCFYIYTLITLILLIVFMIQMNMG